LLTDRSDPQWFASKIPVLRNYRFTIAFENEEHPGYTTEKILHAWAADSVPIYWGNPLLTVDFPPDSYLSLHEAGSVSRLVEQVLEAHRDPARYDELRRANPIRTGRLDELVNGFREGLAPFLRAIVDDAARFQGRSRRHPTRRALNAARFGRWWARDELSKRIG
jgi:hypothetical protein